MRLEYDADVDAAYLYVADEIPLGGVATTVAVDPADINGQVNIDLDADGRIIGIEVLDASRLLPQALTR